MKADDLAEAKAAAARARVLRDAARKEFNIGYPKADKDRRAELTENLAQAEEEVVFTTNEVGKAHGKDVVERTPTAVKRKVEELQRALEPGMLSPAAERKFNDLRAIVGIRLDH